MKYSKPVTKLRDIIEAVTDIDISEEILLPITHLPKWTRLSQILEDGILKPSEGNEHYENQRLLFFTYGRNVFIPKSARHKENEAYPPFVFIFQLTNIEQRPLRMLPFDSGGFKLYEMEDGLTPKHFEIPFINNDDIRKLTFALFKSYKKYLEYEHDFGELIDNCPLLPNIRSLHKLYNTVKNETTEIGMQAKSFEIQFSDEIPLKPYLLLAPQKLMTGTSALSQLQWQFPNSKIIIYETPGHPHAHIQNINKALSKHIHETFSEKS